MGLLSERDSITLVAYLIKPCPFCAGRAVVTENIDREVFSIECCGCSLQFMNVFKSFEEAALMWCRRRSTVSAAGGRATRGLSTRKKRRACRRNLRRARKMKKLKWIRSQYEPLYQRNKARLAEEIAELKAALKDDLAYFKEREHLIIDNPTLREFYEFVIGQINDHGNSETDACSVAEPRPEGSVLANGVWGNA